MGSAERQVWALVATSRNEIMGAMSYVVAAFWLLAITVVIVQIIRSRRYGPRVLWFPRRLRPKVNDYFRRHAWRKPYDENGTRRNWWSNEP
jgi:hypothetical protein